MGSDHVDGGGKWRETMWVGRENGERPCRWGGEMERKQVGGGGRWRTTI